MTGKRKAVELTFDELKPWFSEPMHSVAKSLGVCTTVFKKMCRRNSISKWPYRQLKNLESNLEASREKLHTVQNDNERAALEFEISALMERRRQLLETGTCDDEARDARAISEHILWLQLQSAKLAAAGAVGTECELRGMAYRSVARAPPSSYRSSALEPSSPRGSHSHSHSLSALVRSSPRASTPACFYSSEASAFSPPGYAMPGHDPSVASLRSPSNLDPFQSPWSPAGRRTMHLRPSHGSRFPSVHFPGFEGNIPSVRATTVSPFPCGPLPLHKSSGSDASPVSSNTSMASSCSTPPFCPGVRTFSSACSSKPEPISFLELSRTSLIESNFDAFTEHNEDSSEPNCTESGVAVTLEKLDAGQFTDVEWLKELDSLVHGLGGSWTQAPYSAGDFDLSKDDWESYLVDL